MDPVTLGMAKTDARKRYAPKKGVITPEVFGAAGDVEYLSAASISPGTAVLSASRDFTAADVGKIVVVQDAGQTVTYSTTASASATSGATSISVTSYIPRGYYRIGGVRYFVNQCQGTAAPYIAQLASALTAPVASAAAIQSDSNLVTTIASVSSGDAVLAHASTYGCTGKTVVIGTDDTDAVQDFLDDDTGAIKYFAGTYLCPSGVTLTVPSRIFGHGGYIGDGGPFPRIASGIVVTSPTATGLAVNGSGHALEGFGILNIGTEPTAGAGIDISIGHAVSADNLTVAGFYDGWHWTGCYWQMNSCNVYDWVNNGLYVRNSTASSDTYDHGDFGVFNSVFSNVYRQGMSRKAIRWESGGGIRLVGGKINARGQTGNSRGNVLARGIDIAPAAYTADLQVTGMNIANTYDGAIVLHNETSGSGGMSDLNITGNLINVTYYHETSAQSYPAMGVVVDGFAGSNWNTFRGLIIGANTFQGLQGSDIFLRNVNGVHVAPNVHFFSARTDPVIKIDSGINSGSASATHITVDRQSYAWSQGSGQYGMAFTAIEDKRNNDVYNRGVTEHDYGRAVRIAAKDTDFSLWQLGLWGNSTSGNAARVTLELSGQTADGEVYVRQDRVLLRAINSTTHTVTSIGDDIAAGTGALTVTWDVSTDATKLALKVKIPASATGVTAGLRARLRIEGGVQTVYQFAS